MDIDKIRTTKIINIAPKTMDPRCRPAEFWPKNCGLRIETKTTDPGVIYSDDRLGFAEKLWIRRDVD